MELVAFPFLFGVLAFLSPCILPMLQVYLSLITGSTMQQLTSASHDSAGARRKVFVRTILFILGFTLVFVTAGIFAGTVGSFLRDRTVILNYVGGAIIVLFGLKMLGVLKMGFLHRLHLEPERFSLLRKGGGNLEAFTIGLFFAIACSHCFGPLLYSTLIVAAGTQSSMQGLSILLSFSIGLAIPYLLTATALPAVLGILRRSKRAALAIMKLSGGFLVLFGILVVFGKFQVLATVFSKILPWGDTLSQTL